MRMSTGRVRRRTGTLRSDSRFFLAIVGGRISSYFLMRSTKSTVVGIITSVKFRLSAFEERTYWLGDDLELRTWSRL